MKLIELVDEQIRLNSHLNEYSFGKTNYDSVLAQEGILWDGEKFSAWSFTDVQSYDVDGKDERYVFYCGKNPVGKNAVTLQEYFTDGGEEMFAAAKLVCKVLTQAAKDEQKIPEVGPGGILINLVSGTVLFLPHDLFQTSTNGLSKTEQFNAHFAILNQTIHDLPALCFTRASIVYKTLTGNFPFQKEDDVERNSDILDRNFLPFELCIENVNAQLAKAVNLGLKLNANVVNVPGKKKKGKSSEDLTPVPDFPIELLDEAWELAKKQRENGNADFEERSRNYMKAKNSRISAKRKIRKNSLTIITVFIIAVVTGFIIANSINSRREEFTTKGLTSTQTIQAFFYGVNTKSTTLLDNVTKGKNPRRYVDTVSQIYVLSKQRQTYSNDNGFAAPEEWLVYSTSAERYKNSGIYGITNLRIDGSSNVYELDIEMKTFKDNPEPVTKEGDITIENGSVSVHTADYYLIYSEGEDNQFFVENIHETFTLTFFKDRWRITNIQTESKMIKTNCKEFLADYLLALEENNGKQVEAVDSLRNKYEWLPSHYSMKKEYDRVIWEAEHPLEAMGLR